MADRDNSKIEVRPQREKLQRTKPHKTGSKPQGEGEQIERTLSHTCTSRVPWRPGAPSGSGPAGIFRRREGETYDDFIARGASNPLVRRVKLADIEDNLDDLRRLEEIDEKDLERLQRYQRVRKVILAAMGIS